MSKSLTRPEVGHNFLASLGKRRLRPGGKEGTEWLLDHLDQNKPLKVLEVACNQGTTTFELVDKYPIDIVACDLSEDALNRARKRAKNHPKKDHIEFRIADARSLPFEDNSFDIVINEAMLTMLSDVDKLKALKEYHRVLKPGGKVLTHDVLFRTDDKAYQVKIRKDMTRNILANVKPLTGVEWESLFTSCGFIVQSKTGPMSLMDPKGMIKDEGFGGTLKIVSNALKLKNRARFKAMFKMFKEYQDDLGFIVVAGVKKD